MTDEGGIGQHNPEDILPKDQALTGEEMTAAGATPLPASLKVESPLTAGDPTVTEIQAELAELEQQYRDLSDGGVGPEDPRVLELTEKIDQHRGTLHRIRLEDPGRFSQLKETVTTATDNATERNREYKRVNEAGAAYLSEMRSSGRMVEIPYTDMVQVNENQIMLTSGHLSPILGYIVELQGQGLLENTTFYTGTEMTEGTEVAAVFPRDGLIEITLANQDNLPFLAELLRAMQQEMALTNVRMMAKFARESEVELKEAEAQQKTAEAEILRKTMISEKYRVRRLRQSAAPIKNLVVELRDKGVDINSKVDPISYQGVYKPFGDALIALCDQNLLEGDFADPATEAEVQRIIQDCNAEDIFRSFTAAEGGSTTLASPESQ